MKHLLPILTLALLGAAAPAFAAFNFELLWQQYDNSAYEGNDGRYFTIRVTGEAGEKGKIYLTDMFNTIGDGVQNEALNGVTENGVKVTQFGYTYTKQGMSGVQPFEMTPASDRIVPLDSETDSLLHTYSYYDEEGKHSRTRNGYYLGEFEAGDEIQVYLQATQNDGEAMSVTSNDPDGEYNSKTLARVDRLNDYLLQSNLTDKQLLIASLYLQDQINFGILGDPGNGSGYVYGVAKEVTVGTPLPGGASVALIAAIFGLGLWYVRRRKAIAG